MLKNSPEYKETLQKTYNELPLSMRSPFSFQFWKMAFEAGFDSVKSPEEEERIKKESKETFIIEEDETE